LYDTLLSLPPPRTGQSAILPPFFQASPPALRGSHSHGRLSRNWEGSRPSQSHINGLQPVHALGRPNVDRLFDLNTRHFLARLVEAQHGIVVHVEPLPVNLGFEHFRTRNDIVPEDDLLAGSP